MIQYAKTRDNSIILSDTVQYSTELSTALYYRVCVDKKFVMLV